MSLNQARGMSSFVPREVVSTVVGRQTYQLYPKIDDSFSIEERAYAVHCLVAALEALRVEQRLYYDTIGTHLNCAAVVDGLIHDWLSHFDRNCFNMANITILSFHNAAGAIMNNAHDADPQVLLPVQDGPIPQCRPPGVRFVRLQLTLDFAQLAAAGVGNTVLRTQYYLELPQTSDEVLDGNGNPRQLVTWHGAADLRTLTVDQIRTDILDNVTYDVPIGLSESAFNVTNATIDEVSILEDTHKRILRMARKTVLKNVFEYLCPNYTARPQAAVENVWQMGTDKEGNTITVSIAIYTQRFWSALRPFVNMETWPIDACRVYLDHMHADIISAMQEIYTAFHDPVDRAGRVQRSKLGDLNKLAARAETKVQTVQNVVRGNMGTSFVASASAYPSQAEMTLQRYQKTGDDTSNKDGVLRMFNGDPVKCYGCGENHYWKKDGKPVCPKFDDPKCKANAELEYAKLERNNNRRRRPRSGGGASKRWRNKRPNFDDLDAEAKEKMTKQVLASLGAAAPGDKSSVQPGATDPSPSTESATRSAPRPRVFIIGATCLNAAGREPMPVPIDTQLPHIHWQLGTTLGDPKCPSVRAVLDTAASLNTGSFAFFKKLAAQFPECVARVLTDKSYNPISLSGIVQVDGEAVSTLLPVAFVFHTPYKCKDGAECQIIIATGPHVTVNCIFGLAFMRGTQTMIDLKDNVADLGALDAPPFPLENIPAQLVSPVEPSASSVPANVAHAEFVRELDQLEQYVASSYAAHANDLPPKKKHLRFNLPPSSVDGLADGQLPGVPNTNGALPSVPEGEPPEFAEQSAHGGQLSDPLSDYREPSSVEEPEDDEAMSE